MTFANQETTYVVQYKNMYGNWEDVEEYDLETEADDRAKSYGASMVLKLRVVERKTVDTVCLGWRVGDKAIARGTDGR